MPLPPPVSAARRASLAAFALGALIVAACGHEPTGAGMPGRAMLQFGPLFQTGGTTRIKDSITALRFTVTRTSPAPAQVITNVVQPLVDSSQHGPDSLSVSFPLQGNDAVYEVLVKAVSFQGDTFYQIGPLRFAASQIDAKGAVRLEISNNSILYVGPGSEATRIAASQHVVNLAAGQSVQLTATAYGPTGAVIPRARFDWSNLTSNGVASVSSDGFVFANNQRGTEKIGVGIQSALAPVDTVIVNVALGPAQLVLVAGGGQSALAGTQLASPIFVRVQAFDGVPVSGVAVQFSPTSGSVSASSVTTSVAGIAQTSWTLGPSVGNQTLNVSVPGAQVPQLQVQATATQVVASTISILSVLPSAITTTQAATITAQALGANGQPISGAQMTFSATGSGNTLNPVSVATGPTGQAISVFSSTVAETKTITVRSGNASATASLPVVLPTSSATQLIKVSGDNQTVHYGTTYGQPLTVQALNAAGQPVPGALIDWGTANGSVRKVTDSNGMSSNLYFLPNDPVTYPPGQNPVFVTLVATPPVLVTFHYIAAP